MYCRICGKQHGEEVNYCPNEGSMATAATATVALERDNSKFCRGCGEENEQENLYCQKCGHSLFAAKKKESIIKVPSVGNNPKVKLSLNKSDLQSGIIGGAIASVCMLIAGWLGNLVFAALMEKIFREFGREFDVLSSFYNGTTSTLLSYHLLGFTVGDAGGNVLTLSWHTPFFLLLIIPFIILGGTGIWLGKQRTINTIGKQIVVAATVGLVYGLFLFVVSFIASKSIELPQIGTVTAGYSSLKSLLSGFVCGTLFSLIGFIAHTSRRNMAEAFHELLPYGASIYYGISSMVKGLLLTAVILCGATLATNLDSVKPLKELTSTPTEQIMLTLQLTPHVWNMAHLAPVEIKSPALADKYSKLSKKDDENALQLSFVSGLSFNGTKIKDWAVAERAPQSVIDDIDKTNSKFHYGLLLLLIPFFSMFRAGQKLAKMPTSNVYVTLAVCSGAYTVSMIVMNILSKFQIDMTGNITKFFGINGTMLSLQNHVGYLILGSFVLTYVAAFVGMKLARK
ncbi:hypothetical protein ACFDTO_36970 [Microbacteriaceae bacterium 4G12]